MTTARGMNGPGIAQGGKHDGQLTSVGPGAGADVINMSLGGYYTQSGWVINPANPSRSFFVGANAIAAHVNAHKWAADYAHWLGVTLIASAGNNAINRDQAADLICLPGDLSKVIQVSATGPCGWALNTDTNLDLPAAYADYGQSAIALAAPGGFSPQPHPTRAYWPLDPGVSTPDWAFDLVLVADHNRGWSWVSGTSFAAPHVAGVAHPNPDAIRTNIEKVRQRREAAKTVTPGDRDAVFDRRIKEHTREVQ